jgi:penicillin-binding protein 2
MLEPIRPRRATEDDSFIGVRVSVLLIMGMLLFGVLGFRLWYLQILTGDQFVSNSSSNRVRSVVIEAPRGVIYDRNGVALVQNRAGLSVGMLPMGMPEPDSEEFYAEIYALADLLALPAADLFAAYERAATAPYTTYVVKQDVDETTVVAYLEQHNGDFPGIEVEKAYLRYYTYENGAIASHILGYVGEISENDLDQPEFAELIGGTHVGKDGVERQYDSYLRGRDGRRTIEVDANGRPIKITQNFEAETGYNLYLTIDSTLQYAAEEALKEGIQRAHNSGFEESAAGAVVAMDPFTGEILAMASYPDYDPDAWVGGISQADFAAYNATDANRPLFNRALNGLYPAASTFKPFVATVALEAGIVTAVTTRVCWGSFRLESQVGNQKVYQRWKCWNPYGHREVNMIQALQRSCDVYFYNLGEALYYLSSPVLQNGIRRYGFGRTTGVDLPGETQGSRVPDKVWARERGTEWKTGDEINLAIGQGDLLITPLQEAVALSAIVNGGTLLVPHVGLRITDAANRVISTIESERRSDLGMDPAYLEVVKAGMVQVCLPRDGTAWEAWYRFPVDVAGKTGTAQVLPYEDYALFMGYAPANATTQPQIVVVAVIEQGGHGATVAAPVVRRVMESFFDLPRGNIYIGTTTE